MKKVFLIAIIVCAAFATESMAQSKGRLLIGGGLDLLKTDLNSPFQKTQLGVEANYFLIRGLSFSGGIEMWSEGSNSVAIGTRFYPINPVFLRMRGLIGANDFSLGMGYSQALTGNLRFEGTGDFYFEGNFALRAGIAYLF